MVGVVRNYHTQDPTGGTMEGLFANGPAGSRGGEDNSWHVIAAIVGVALVALVAGVINVKIAAGR